MFFFTVAYTTVISRSGLYEMLGVFFVLRVWFYLFANRHFLFSGQNGGSTGCL